MKGGANSLLEKREAGIPVRISSGDPVESGRQEGLPHTAQAARLNRWLKPRIGCRSGALFMMIAVAMLMPHLACSQALQATITGTSNETTAGFVVGADKEGILLSLVPEGGNAFKYPYAKIKEYDIVEPKGWSATVALFQAGNLAEAEKQFEAFGTALEKLVPLRDSYGSLAKYYWFMSLKQQGKLAQLSSAMDRQLVNPVVLSEAFQEDLLDLQGWAIVGKQDWVQLMAYLQGYQDKSLQKDLPLPPFKKASRARLASLSGLRAILEEHDGSKDLALLDYHAALTHDLGSDRSLTAMALTGALRLANEQLLAKPDDAGLKRQAWSLAVSYRDLVGGGQVPPEYAKLLEAPPQAVVPPQPPK